MKYVYDLDTGELKTFEGRNGPEPIERSGPPPCSDCPKKSPEHEHEFVMSRKNVRLYDFYRRYRWNRSMELPEHLRGCRVFQESMALISELESDLKHSQHTRQLKDLLLLVAMRR